MKSSPQNWGELPSGVFEELPSTLVIGSCEVLASAGVAAVFHLLASMPGPSACEGGSLMGHGPGIVGCGGVGWKRGRSISSTPRWVMSYLVCENNDCAYQPSGRLEVLGSEPQLRPLDRAKPFILGYIC